jgi:hypothetical protein
MSPLAANEWAFVNGQPVIKIRVLTAPATDLVCEVHSAALYGLLLSPRKAGVLKFVPRRAQHEKIVLVDGSVLWTRRGLLRVRCLRKDWDVRADILDKASAGAHADYFSLEAAVGALFFRRHRLAIDDANQKVRLDSPP